MTEAIETEVVETPAKPRKMVKKRRKAKTSNARTPKVEPDKPVYQGAGEFAGISASACPRACTAGHCVISTVGICKHPFKTADNGCGPVTMANRARAKKLIKHQQIDLTE